jgi:hypothetical protein
MKLSLLVAPQFSVSYKKLIQQEKLPLRTSFKLRGIHSRIDEEISRYNEMRTEILKKYCVKDEKGEPKKEIVDGNEIINIAPEMRVEYQQKIVELGNIEVELPTISCEDLGSAVNLTAEDLIFLAFIKE